ncbi:hypothetical protein GCM10010172_07520 [Paractinoplanes ferrugineus]|uniref:FHA domain-containing protein n=1 Tax=Paractinoplanes ferrugineus TaxID=113564 RepID=A0A919J974_9ACTN|nr:FHA domain-containing protein [Actinoplanes ferrugineus]GIE16855.1 hypothetical protein Afe05nite_86950 [Actinoplanes ferrugineus]
MAVIRTFTIGTGEGCDLRVEDGYASPRHAKIDQHDDGTFVIDDLASTNGTWIRRPGMAFPIKVRCGLGIDLKPGDIVKVGRTEIPWRNA